MFQVTVESTTELRIDCRVKDKDNNTVRGYYRAARDGDRYTLSFASPGEGHHTARVYQIDAAGIWNTICYFRLPEVESPRKME